MSDERPPHGGSAVLRKRLAANLAGLSLLCGAAGAPLAQEPFPTHSIEIIVTFGPGGGADRMAREIARLLEPALGVPVFVTNVAGASGNVGLTRLLTNSSDGHTIATLISFTVAAWASGVGYARPDDFVVLAIPQQSPSMLFVPADSPFKTFAELLQFAQANPNEVRIATSGYGSNDDITLRYFAALGYKMVNVPYAKPEDRYASIFDGRTHALYEEPGDVADLLASKRLRPLVVFDTERHYAFREIPSSRELGFEINDLPNFRMLVVRAGTPADRVKALTRAISNALDTPEWQAYCARTYSCTRKLTPDEARQRIKSFFETSQRYLRRFTSEPGEYGSSAATPRPRRRSRFGGPSAAGNAAQARCVPGHAADRALC